MFARQYVETAFLFLLKKLVTMGILLELMVVQPPVKLFMAGLAPLLIPLVQKHVEMDLLLFLQARLVTIIIRITMMDVVLCVLLNTDFHVLERSQFVHQHAEMDIRLSTKLVMTII